MTEEKLTEGWGWPGAARKAHYFTATGKGRSLCGAWLYLGTLTKNQGTSSPDDCGLCTRELKKMQATKAKKDTKHASEAQKTGEGDQQNSPGNGG